MVEYHAGVRSIFRSTIIFSIESTYRSQACTRARAPTIQEAFVPKLFSMLDAISRTLL